MKTGFIAAYILFCFTTAMSQNLVMNPSFEDVRMSRFRTDSFPALFWSQTLYSQTVDLYSTLNPNNNLKIPETDFGHFFAADGNSCVGIGLIRWNGEQEYITGTLKGSLIKDSTYRVSFYCRYSDSVWLYSSKIEVLFSATPDIFKEYYGSTNYRDLYNKNKLVASLQFNITDAYEQCCEWKKYSALYKAKGGEKYITFGIFYQGEMFKLLFARYIKLFLDEKKQARFVKNHEIDPIYVNKRFQRTSKNRLRDFAYYFLDEVSVEKVSLQIRK